jgi:acetyl-CoA carboxylase carboxyl transferase subunit alpha
MDYTLDFEKPVAELENQIKELQEASAKPGIDISKEIEVLQAKVDSLIQDIYGNLTPWERTLLSRHQNRPHSIDYIENLIEDFHEIHGDRNFATDKSVIGGFGYFKGNKVAIIAIEKGRKTNEKIQRNFGMPKPEGYRKALRIMRTAASFSIPIITFIDTPGAYPGIGAEERGQSQAIAENIAQMFDINSPIISVVVGEGGSGGALGIAIADRVLMMEYAVYSVISPESCASILWADPKKAEMAANALQLGPNKAKELKVVDDIIKEPAGGAHRNHKLTYEFMAEKLKKELDKLKKNDIETLKEKRYMKFREMGNITLSQDSEDPNKIPLKKG